MKKPHKCGKLESELNTPSPKPMTKPQLIEQGIVERHSEIAFYRDINNLREDLVYYLFRPSDVTYFYSPDNCDPMKAIISYGEEEIWVFEHSIHKTASSEYPYAVYSRQDFHYTKKQSYKEYLARAASHGVVPCHDKKCPIWQAYRDIELKVSDIFREFESFKYNVRSGRCS